MRRRLYLRGRLANGALRAGPVCLDRRFWRTRRFRLGRHVPGLDLPRVVHEGTQEGFAAKHIHQAGHSLAPPEDLVQRRAMKKAAIAARDL